MKESLQSRHKFLFPFEKNFKSHNHFLWLSQNWSLSIYIAIAYVIFIFVGQAYMKNKQPYKLRPFLIIWNSSLSIFSLIGAIRWFPEVLDTFNKQGIHGIICNRSFKDDNAVTLWAYLFLYSKVLELGDTVFVILRKQELIALQWYHHLATMVYVWYSFVGYPSIARPFSFMNYSVHTVMYFYYALRALRIKTPNWFPMLITVTQIAQMFAGLAIAIYVYMLKSAGKKCGCSKVKISFGLLLYLTLALLFLKLFYNKYLDGKSKTKKD